MNFRLCVYLKGRLGKDREFSRLFSFNYQVFNVIKNEFERIRRRLECPFFLFLSNCSCSLKSFSSILKTFCTHAFIHLIMLRRVVSETFPAEKKEKSFVVLTMFFLLFEIFVVISSSTFSTHARVTVASSNVFSW